jgi:hypothetical protein
MEPLQACGDHHGPIVCCTHRLGHDIKEASRLVSVKGCSTKCLGAHQILVKIVAPFFCAIGASSKLGLRDNC